MSQQIKTMIHVLLLFACGAVFYFLLKKTFFLLFPIFLAFLFSEGIRNSFAKLHPLAAPVKRILTVLLLLIFFGLFSLVAVLLVERLLHYTTNITELITENLDRITGFCKEQVGRLEGFFSKILGQDLENRFTTYLPTFFQDFLKKGLAYLPGWIGAIASFLPRFFISLIIFVISCYYFSCDWQRIRVFYKEKTPPDTQLWLSLGKKHFFRALRQFAKAYLLLYVMNFAVLYLGLTLLRIKNAFGVSFVIALIDLLPVLGCGTVLVPWAIFHVFSGEIGLGIGLGILFVVTLFAHQCAEPKIVGSSIGLHPVLSLVLVLLGLRLFGIWGMILLPLGVTSYLNVRAELNEKNKKVS